MGIIHNLYNGYLSQAKRLSEEMLQQGVFHLSLSYRGKSFTIYSDGTAEVPLREDSSQILRRGSLHSQQTKRIGLQSLGEMVYYLTPDRSEFEELPKDLDSLTEGDIVSLHTLLNSEESTLINRGCQKDLKGIRGVGV